MTVFAESSSYQCKFYFLVWVLFSIGKDISNFHFEILLRKDFSYFLKSEASLFVNGNSRKVLKEG